MVTAAHCDAFLHKEKHKRKCVKNTSEGQYYRKSLNCCLDTKHF